MSTRNIALVGDSRTISLDRLVNYLKSKGGMEHTDAIAIDDFPFEARAWGLPSREETLAYV